MVNYEVTETTIDGERLELGTDLDANNMNNAAVKYFQQHADPAAIRGLDVRGPGGENRWYSLSQLEGMDMSD